MDELAKLKAGIREASDPAVVVRRVVDQALALIGPADGAVVELAEGDELHYVCCAGSLAAHVGTRLRVEGSLSGLAVQTGETVHCVNAEQDARVDVDACRRVGAMSMVCVPLSRGGAPIGALKVSSASPGAFTDLDVAMLTRLAEFVSIAVDASTQLARVATELTTRSSPPGGDDAGESDTRGLGEFVANVLLPGMVPDAAVRRRVERALSAGSFRIVAQPIVELSSGRLAGVEALSRFTAPPPQPPDAWFDDAQAVGLGVALQLAAAARALEMFEQLPDAVFLSVNVGPEALGAPELLEMLPECVADRVVVELTEHLKIEDYVQVGAEVRALRERGARLAIDDAGAGFSSLAHIVNLGPDLIKLDRHLTRGLDSDPARRALAAALTSFAEEIGAQVVAEGIETVGELEASRELGIAFGQGYFIGRPGPIGGLPCVFPQVTGASRGARAVMRHG